MDRYGERRTGVTHSEISVHLPTQLNKKGPTTLFIQSASEQPVSVCLPCILSQLLRFDTLRLLELGNVI